MPRPTAEQLEKINRLTLTPLTEDNCFVFRDMMIDDLPTAYYSIVHRNLLRKFVKDASKGIALLIGHDTSKLPVGRSFHAELKEEYVEEKDAVVTSVYGDFYIALGRKTDNGMTTDDICQGIESGTIFDTSIGFKASSWKCSICGYDIRDYMNCPHFPGRRYEVEGEDGVFKTVTCYVIVGEDGEGELLENSLVYAGAVERATIKRDFSDSVGVIPIDKGTTLQLVDSFKNVPLDATLYQFYSKNGVVIYTDTTERTNGLEELVKRSEEKLTFEEFKAVVKEFDLPTDSVEKFKESLTKLVDGKDLDAKLAEKDGKIEELEGSLSQLTSELDELKDQLSQKDERISELEELNQSLMEKAEVADAYRQNLIKEALEAGVRAQGNAFNTELYSKVLEGLSVDEIKAFKEGFEAEFKARFKGVRISKGGNATSRYAEEPKYREDFENDQEFRDFVAEEAKKYAKEHNVSLSEATKEVYAKYKARRDG